MLFDKYPISLFYDKTEPIADQQITSDPQNISKVKIRKHAGIDISLFTIHMFIYLLLLK